MNDVTRHKLLERNTLLVKHDSDLVAGASVNIVPVKPERAWSKTANSVHQCYDKRYEARFAKTKYECDGAPLLRNIPNTIGRPLVCS